MHSAPPTPSVPTKISYQTGLAPAALTDVLFDLEDLNAIKRLPGIRFRRKN